MDTLYTLKKDSSFMKKLNEIFDLMKKYKILFYFKNSDLIISINGNEFIMKDAKGGVNDETINSVPPFTDYKVYYLGEIKK